jgi:DNA-3-methyladenine glycosylase
MKKLPVEFYRRTDVLQIAKELLGKVLITTFAGIETAGRIVEVEAYNGVMDKASHAYGGRRTQRTEVMYAAGGVAYVYLCYGIHHLFNVVTNTKEVPHAILIRAIEPLTGIDEMLKRRKKSKEDYSLTKGPGSVGQALGITVEHTATSLLGNEIFITDDSFRYPKTTIGVTPRIGVDYAGADALLPYRFCVKGNKYVSGNSRKDGKSATK